MHHRMRSAQSYQPIAAQCEFDTFLVKCAMSVSCACSGCDCGCCRELAQRGKREWKTREEEDVGQSSIARTEQDLFKRENERREENKEQQKEREGERGREREMTH